MMLLATKQTEKIYNDTSYRKLGNKDNTMRVSDENAEYEILD